MQAARHVEQAIREDLASKMVFLAGPRQVGKTTLARRLLAEFPAGRYLSWDRRGDRAAIRAARWPEGNALVVLDEIHKWRPWKRWIKGEYDAHGERTRFLVTGSARLDVYRRGGDSLQGRYYLHRLHPFTLGELARPGTAVPVPAPAAPVETDGGKHEDALALLLERGGFPEPLFSSSARVHRRWLTARLDRFLLEDIRDLEAIRDLGTLQVLVDLLPARVGSLLSVNALREDLEVSHDAVSRWMVALDRLYYCYSLAPFASRSIRSLRRMPKMYLWDWSAVPAPGPRFENMVASHLLKFCHRIQDTEGRRVELRYLRERSGAEVDFLVVEDGRPWFAVEAKLSEDDPDRALRRLASALRIPFAYQVVREGDADFVEDGVRVVPAARFLAALA